MVKLDGTLVKDGANYHGDIEIQVTGLCQRENFYEELSIGDNPQLTAHPKIIKAHEKFLSSMIFSKCLKSLTWHWMYLMMSRLEISL
jgi:FlaA1/EpsC-like NDP-sugar epimerase